VSDLPTKIKPTPQERHDTYPVTVWTCRYFTVSVKVVEAVIEELTESLAVKIKLTVDVVLAVGVGVPVLFPPPPQPVILRPPTVKNAIANSSGRRILRRLPVTNPQINKLAYMAVIVLLCRSVGVPSFVEATWPTDRKFPRSAGNAELHAVPIPIVSCVVLTVLTGKEAME
jgi:hypothetical protein